MGDLEKWSAFLGIPVIVLAIGKYLVPLMSRAVDNIGGTMKASGTILAQVQAERDQWKARAESLDAALQKMREENAKMISRFDVLEYRLQESERQNGLLRSELESVKAELRIYRGERANG